MYLYCNLCCILLSADYLSTDPAHFKFVGRNLEVIHQPQPERDSDSGVYGAKVDLVSP